MAASHWSSSSRDINSRGSTFRYWSTPVASRARPSQAEPSSAIPPRLGGIVRVVAVPPTHKIPLVMTLKVHSNSTTQLGLVPQASVLNLFPDRSTT